MLGEALRSLRHTQSVTQHELAERLGGNLDPRSLRRLESGERRPGRLLLLGLLGALGVQEREAVDHMLALAGLAGSTDAEFADVRAQIQSVASAPLASPPRPLQLIRELQETAADAENASRYHDVVLEALTRIFATQLRKPVKEERLNEGRKRVDIIFNNVADHGFFQALREHHGVQCPYVFFECKNYAMELGNPEFDQLIGRFSDKSGLFGALVCRLNADPQLSLKRSRDAVAKNRGYVIVLDDSDLGALLDYRAKGNEAAIDDHMDNLFRRLVL